MTLAADLIRERLGGILPTDLMDRTVRTVFRSPDRGATTIVNRLVQPRLQDNLLRSHLGYTDEIGVSASPAGCEALRELRLWFDANADDAGLVAEVSPRPSGRAVVPGVLDLLLQRLGLHRYSGYISSRRNRAAQVKAAILALGKPSTKRGDRGRRRPRH